MKYSVHISYLSFEAADPIEEQVVKEFSCILPAVLYCLKANLNPSWAVPEIPVFSILLREYYGIQINLYRD